MPQRCQTYDKLFRAIVVMGAAIGVAAAAAACDEDGKPAIDAGVADAGTDALTDGAPVDIIAIL